MITSDRNYRNFTVQLDQDDEMKAYGTPIVFNQETILYKDEDGKEYKEIISDTALTGVDISDVVLNIDHEGKPAAKTKNNTLKLTVRNDGLFMEADLSKNSTGRELHEDIRNGFYDKMSFAFTAEADEYDSESRTRTITKIKRLYDVSAVTYPAYSQTQLLARDFFKAEAERERKASEDAERRKKLIVQTYL